MSQPDHSLDDSSPLAGDGPKRFSNRATDYVAGRPTYPLAVIEVLKARIGFDRDWAVVDVGAGTGISAELFLKAGNAVIAVEPNDAMRNAADEQLSGNASYCSVAAPAEATTLQSGSADLVVAAQAFHWFDRNAFATECSRLLSPRGRVLLMWNDRDGVATPFAAGLEAIINQFSIDYLRVQKKWPLEAEVAKWFQTEDYIFVELPNDQHQTFDALAARVASSSYMPPRDHANFAPMMAALRS
ncbi:MAG: class SAM-dependent methyltransferase [Phycisphaerales bacterium]|nr:class SAM-dependent methyltransferase [Phycisphaerales bacterium]